MNVDATLSSRLYLHLSAGCTRLWSTHITAPYARYHCAEGGRFDRVAKRQIPFLSLSLFFLRVYTFGRVIGKRYILPLDENGCFIEWYRPACHKNHRRRVSATGSRDKEGENSCKSNYFAHVRVQFSLFDLNLK